MKPDRVRSLWVKHLPWYWAKDRRTPSRQDVLRQAIENETISECGEKL
jgi:hypothetical protein